MNFSAFSALNKPFLSLAHWLALCLLVASIWSGVNLALDNRPWLLTLLPWWPGMRAVPFWHLQAGLGWLVLLTLWLLCRTPERIAGGAQPALRRHWRVVRPLRLVLGLLLLSGCLLYWLPGGFGSNVLRWVHLSSLALLLPLLLWHGLTEWRIGAWPRVRQLFLRTPLGKPGTSLRVGALLLACALLLALALHGWQSSQTLPVPKIRAEMQIDGMANEPAWQLATPMLIQTYYGAPYSRAVPVEIRMLHDGYTLYVHARWPDPTHSRQHLPLIKTATGWQVQQSALLAADEQVFYEDKFAVMIADQPWAALHSVFLGGPVQPGLQKQQRARGGHRMPGGEMVDVWHWKSVRNHQFGNLDDAFFGDGLPYLPGQRRYTWGYASDPLLAGGYKENWAWFDETGVTPLRLPRQPSALAAFQQPASGPPLALDWHDSQPYNKALDTFAPGTVLPSVVWIHPNEGDRAHVRANGLWRDGYWHLEMARGLDTGSAFDKPLHTGSFLWFATFDHAQTRHTWHMRPLRLELAP